MKLAILCFDPMEKKWAHSLIICHTKLIKEIIAQVLLQKKKKIMYNF